MVRYIYFLLAEGEEVTHPRSNSPLIAESIDNVNSSGSSPMNIESTMTTEAPLLGLPFAVFDEVQEGSPAALDGIMYGDQLIKFGSVAGGDNLLQRIAREGQLNEGISIPVIVLRRGIQVRLTVTPRHWMGRGLLG